MTKKLLLVLLVLAVAPAVCLAVTGSYLRFASRRTPAGQPALQTLDAGSLAAFRETFSFSEWAAINFSTMDHISPPRLL